MVRCIIDFHSIIFWRFFQLNFRDFIKKDVESQNEYLARTYWNRTEEKVSVFESEKAVLDYNSKGKVISIEKARNQLHRCKPDEKVYKGKQIRTREEVKDESSTMVKISCENVSDEKITSLIWQDTFSGEVMHEVI